MITIYTLAYNEEKMLPHFIKHYQTMFPNCLIVVYDNESTDNTVKIAKENFCEVRTYATGGKLSDPTYLQIKNNCWKDATTDWVIIADVDEHCYVNTDAIMHEQIHSSILRFQGFNMVNVDGRPVDKIDTGVRATSYDKFFCFNKKHIKEINYTPGCHGARPIGAVKYSDRIYNCWHYKYVDVEYMVARHAMFAERLSPENIEKGYGFHYKYPAEQIRKEFETVKQNAYVIEKWNLGSVDGR